jgi:hypothetical protein
VNPNTVLSPKQSVSNLCVIFDGGLYNVNDPWSGMSVAQLLWEGSPAVGIRWNGVLGENVGQPQSRGLPTWFILPDPLVGPVLDCIDQHVKGGNSASAEALPPRRRLLDLIAFVRAASDAELASMIDQMALSPAKGA